MPESTRNEIRLDVLLARLVEATLTPDQFEELESLLDGNREAQRRYLHYLGLHADMMEPGMLVRNGSERASTSRRWSSRALFATAAVVAVVMVTIALVVRLNPNPPDQVDTGSPRPIARIVELNGSVSWTGDGGQLTPNLDVDQLLGGGTLETLAQNSWAEIEFLDGSRVWVSGPAVLTVSEGTAGKLIRLRHGELSVEVRPQPAGRAFRLMTSSAEMEVVGTQFNVVADSYSTRVSVNEGLVRVRRLADGKEQRVPADHRAVVALERGSVFEVLPRQQHVEVWKSELPGDLRYGEWRSEGSTSAVRAKPLLWTEDPRNPVLLHVASFRPSASDFSPVRLTEDARVRIRGRLDQDHEVVFGLTTLHAAGGFAGKYSTLRRVPVDRDAEGTFEVTLPLDDFHPQKECFPHSPVGHELFDCWILTIEEEVGLEVRSVELLK